MDLDGHELGDHEPNGPDLNGELVGVNDHELVGHEVDGRAWVGRSGGRAFCELFPFVDKPEYNHYILARGFVVYLILFSLLGKILRTSCAHFHCLREFSYN